MNSEPIEPESGKSNLHKIMIFLLANFIILPFIISLFSEEEEEFSIEMIDSLLEKTEVQMDLNKCLEKNNLDFPTDRCDLLAFKNERVLEIWAGDDSTMKFIKSYNFTAYCGRLGPKLREGDLQIPEGEYKISYLNPESKYHLSMCLDYPNSFDLAMAEKDGRLDPGSDICIHGKNVTIGCIPIGDKAIEELYRFVEAVGLDSVNVFIFPNDARINGHFEECPDCPEWTDSLYSGLEIILDRYTK